MKRKIYIASSWRNEHQNSVVRACRALGHEVYDFKNSPNKLGFNWGQIDNNYKIWTTKEYIEALYSPLATERFNADMEALNWCDTCVLLLPCGRSAHLEAGYCLGQQKDTFIFVSKEQFEPELMYKMAKHRIFDNIEGIYHLLGRHFDEPEPKD